MTEVDTTADLREQLRQQARETYRQSLAAEMPLTGRQLAEMFDRSDRWGRDRIAEVRAQDHLDDLDPGGNPGLGGDSERRQAGEETPRQTSVRPRAAVAAEPAAAHATPAIELSAARASPAELSAPTGEPPAARGTPAAAARLGPPAGVGLAAEDAEAVVTEPAASPVPAPTPVPPEPLPPAGKRQAIVTAEASPAVSAAIRRTTAGAVAVVAVVAAVVSFAHMHDLALKAGEGWRSWLLPLAVDGLIIAASMRMLVRRRQGHRGGALAWCSLILGIAASLAANVAAAAPTWEGRIVAAWPPIALLLAYELLMQQVRDHHTH